MSNKEKELIKGSMWDFIKGSMSYIFSVPTKAIDGFEKIYFHVRRRKVYWLIQSMGSNSQNFSEKDKQNFFHYIESETGQELLEKFIDATLKTSSKTAIVYCSP